ncbi:MAG: glycosyltransferase family 1 protein [Candidatus Doudnabacteria bacterium]
MKIGIEAERANTENPTGVEHYAQQMILNLAKIDQSNEYILYLQNNPAAWFLKLPQNFKIKVLPFPIFWTQIRISAEIIQNPVDALFIMASALPIFHTKNSTVTIHDIAWDYYPETFSFLMRTYLRLSTLYACTYAKKIIAVSEQTKSDLVKKYRLNPEKIDVIYHGFDLDSEMMENNHKDDKQLAKLPKKFILFLSTLQPRKNILGLIEAFLELKKEKGIEHSLVLVGGKGWLYDKIMESIKAHPEIVYCGYVHNRFEFIKRADLLILPSFYEGFGMTILDAFAMRVPVACSNVSSLPEVASDAAVYFNPHDKTDMKKAIYAAITDRGLHDSLVVKGKERLKQFSWQKSAEYTLKSLKK